MRFVVCQFVGHITFAEWDDLLAMPVDPIPPVGEYMSCLNSTSFTFKVASGNPNSLIVAMKRLMVST